jgi:Plasmid pRiA4b ORF-3-like protein
MPAKKSALPPEVFQLKVTLLGTMPPIWRRLLVSADLTLAQLHDVLQAAMGWQDCHMHEFSAGHRRFGEPNPEDRLMGMDPVENERTVRLFSLLGRAGAKSHLYLRYGRQLGARHRAGEAFAGGCGHGLSGLHKRRTRLSSGRFWRYPWILRPTGCSGRPHARTA